jgi:pyruvate,water dikinase
MTIEAAWGLGEAVVSGAVTLDNYVVDRADGSLLEDTVATKTVMHVRDEATGETIKREAPDDKRTERVLTDDEIDRPVTMGKQIEEHYELPQDVEWAIYKSDVYILQSRPITTIDESALDSDTNGGTVNLANGGPETGAPDDETDILMHGVGTAWEARLVGPESFASWTTSTKSMRATSLLPR